MENLIGKITEGDCLEVMKQIPDGAIDLIVTDPPYVGHFDGVGGLLMKREYLNKINKMVGSGEKFNLLPYLEMLKPKMKIFNGYFWCSYKMLHLITGFAIENGFNYNVLTWNKIDPIPLKNNTYLPDCEHCVFIRAKGAFFNSDNAFDRYRKVFRTIVNKSQYGHPTEKPISIIVPSILNSSRENDLILDPFSGSGTTAIACHRLKRRFICIEKEPKYVELSRRRLEQERAQMVLF